MREIEPDRSDQRHSSYPARTARILEAFLPDSIRASEPADRNQARIVAALNLLLLGIGLTVIVGQSIYGDPRAIVVGFAITGLLVPLLIAVRAGLDVQIAGHLTLGVIYMPSIGLMILSGGESVPAALVACIIPALAYVIRGRVAVTGWTVGVVAGVIVAGVYASHGDWFPYEGDMLAWERWRFTTITAITAFVALAALTFDRTLQIATEEAHRSTEDLRVQDARYRSLVENVGDVLMEYDAKTRCVYVSPNCFDVTGHSQDEMIGEGYLASIHPDDVATVRDMYRLLSTKPGETRSLAIRFRHADGQWIHGQTSARAFFARSGELHFVTIFRDVSDLRRAELAMRHSERLAAAGTLAAGVAHQINNPIGSIRNASEYGLLCAKDGDFDPIERVLEGNIEQATQCGEIVRSLLQFAARENPTKARCDLSKIVLRARDFTISYARERGTEIEVESASGSLWVNVSAIEIEQVLVNLIRNAIESGPRSNRIVVETSRHEAWAWVEVRDDGRGIAEVDRALVVDPFFTTRIREGGSGLGLSVAHGIVRDHDGVLEIESIEGAGTCVRVELPLMPDAVVEAG
ncbi:MAG: PAS domain S-box protein [bacterium]|nr:PAS domain S-box protein [bacterium]